MAVLHSSTHSSEYPVVAPVCRSASRLPGSTYAMHLRQQQQPQVEIGVVGRATKGKQQRPRRRQAAGCCTHNAQLT